MSLSSTLHDDLRTRPRRVLLLESQFPLVAGLERLLVNRGGLEVKALPQHQLSDLREVLEEFCPDVLITDPVFLGNNLSELFTMVSTLPQMRIITLSMEDNCLQVFDKREVIVKQVGDLFEVL